MKLERGEGPTTREKRIKTINIRYKADAKEREFEKKITKLVTQHIKFLCNLTSRKMVNFSCLGSLEDKS